MIQLPCKVENINSASQKARFEKGKELLEAEFRSLLTRYSKAVPPILILDAISVDEELEVQEEVVLEHLPEAVLQDIICIAGWLVEYGRNQGMTEWTPLILCCSALWVILSLKRVIWFLISLFYSCTH